MDLPAEIWAQIFNLAADDDLIFQYGLQTSFSVHAWWKAFHGDWLLRSPMEALNYIQKRSYFTKKVRVLYLESFDVTLTQQDDLAGSPSYPLVANGGVLVPRVYSVTSFLTIHQNFSHYVVFCNPNPPPRPRYHLL